MTSVRKEEFTSRVLVPVALVVRYSVLLVVTLAPTQATVCPQVSRLHGYPYVRVCTYARSRHVHAKKKKKVSNKKITTMAGPDAEYNNS